MVDSNLTARAPLALPQQLVWAVLDESRVVFDAARSLLLHVVVCRDVSHLPEHQLRGTPRGSGVKPRGGGSSSWAWGSPPPSRPPPPPHCRRTAAAPPHCWGASCAVPCFLLCEVAFWAAFAYFLDSCAHFCCVGRVQCVLRAVNSVACVLACVCALRFSIECEFALGGMDASGVFRSGVMYSITRSRTGPGGQEGVYIWGILALELIHSSHTTSPAIWWALDVR